MMYSGFVVCYKYGKTHPDQSTHFDGPHSTIQEAHKVYDDLKSLDPTITDVRVCRMVCDHNNPKLY